MYCSAKPLSPKAPQFGAIGPVYLVTPCLDLKCHVKLNRVESACASSPLPLPLPPFLVVSAMWTNGRPPCGNRRSQSASASPGFPQHVHTRQEYMHWEGGGDATLRKWGQKRKYLERKMSLFKQNLPKKVL